jgi:hypothetical protein
MGKPSLRKNLQEKYVKLVLELENTGWYKNVNKANLYEKLWHVVLLDICFDEYMKHNRTKIEKKSSTHEFENSIQQQWRPIMKIPVLLSFFIEFYVENFLNYYKLQFTLAEKGPEC